MAIPYILTTYLTRKPEPQKKHPHSPNDHSKMFLWYPGVQNGVIFHDELSEDFMKHYPKVKFVKVDEYPWLANDGRFWLFRKYLQEHPEVEEVFMTDLFDVKITHTPSTSNKLYVQSEPAIRPETNTNGLWRSGGRWIKNAFKRCYNCEPQGVMLGKPIFNPGVWGGKRKLVLKVLDMIIAELERINTGRRNCNMIVFNKVLYEKFGTENIATGYPLHSVFKAYQYNSTACFIHK